MRYGQDKWTLRWTEHWLSCWAPRVVSPVVRTPQGFDGGLNTFISDVGDGWRHIPSKSAQETKMESSSVLQLCWTSTGQTNGQRAEKRGLREIFIHVSDEGGRKENSQIFKWYPLNWEEAMSTNWKTGILISKCKNFLTHKMKEKTQTN